MSVEQIEHRAAPHAASEGTYISTAVCRLVAAIAMFLAVLFGAAGLVCAPPVLCRWILTDGEVGRRVVLAALYCAAVAGLVAAVVGARAALRLWRRARQVPARTVYLALVAIGLVCITTAVAAEVMTRLVLTPDQVLSGDAWWIYRRVSARASSARIESEYPMNRFDPEIGWVPVPNYRSEAVNTNADGLRGQTDHPDAKPAGKRRVVVIGDSFTFGEDVSDADVYPHLMETMLPDVEILNLGVPGYGTDQQYLRLRRIGFKYQPDLVLLAFFGPDADRNALAFRDYAKPVFRVADGSLRLENVPVPDPKDPTTVFPNPLPAFYSWALVQATWERALDQTRFAPKWEVTRRILDAVLAATDEHHSRLMIAHLPGKLVAFSPGIEDAESIVMAWATNHRVPFVSLREVFRELPPPHRKRVFHGHWTPFGNRVVAQAIVQKIISDGLLENPGK